MGKRKDFFLKEEFQKWLELRSYAKSTIDAYRRDVAKNFIFIDIDENKETKKNALVVYKSIKDSKDILLKRDEDGELPYNIKELRNEKSALAKYMEFLNEYILKSNEWYI